MKKPLRGSPKTIKRNFPELSDSIISEYSKWAFDNGINAVHHLGYMKKWFSYSDILISNLCITELVFFTKRKEDYKSHIKTIKKRGDTVDISVVQIYYPDEEIAKEIYKKYCLNKTKKMVLNTQLHPEQYATKSYDYIVSRYGIENADEIYKKRCFDCGIHVRKEFFMDKGMSLEDAEKALAERQSTFSLEKCIQKFGEEAGTARWKQRQDDWQDTMTSKPEEEIQRINRLKMNAPGCISKSEQELINLLEAKGFPILQQKQLRKDTKGHFMYDICYKNKIIEFHGDYWHANPSLYNEGFINATSKLSATTIWDKDYSKEIIARNNGFDYLVVWEKDFKNDKETVVDDCVKFLNKKFKPKNVILLDC